MGKYDALAGSRLLSRFPDTLIQLRQFWQREPCSVRHSLAEREFRKPAQPFNRNRGGLDDISKLRVMFDLQTGNTETLRKIELQLGNHLTGFVAECPVRIEFGIEARPNCAAIFQACRPRISQCLSEFASQGETSRYRGTGLAERLGKRPMQDLVDCKRSLDPVAYRNKIPGGSAVQRQAAQSARHVWGLRQD